MEEVCERPLSALNSKIHSDINSSGYGSNKSHTTNSQSRRSSGSSSKSPESSLSSGSGYPPHQNEPLSNVEKQPHLPSTPEAESISGKRQGKKKHKLNKKLSSEEKVETCPQEVEIENGNNVMMMEIGIIEKNKVPNIGVGALPTDRSTLSILNTNTQKLLASPSFKIVTTDPGITLGIKWQDYIPQDFTDGSTEDSFSTILTMKDGIVVYISPSITNILGFPKDMPVGRRFADFVHPKDKSVFASHTRGGVNFLDGDEDKSVKSEPFYCRLLQYHALKTLGFVVTDKTVIYHPFKLIMQLQKVAPPLTSEGTNELMEGDVSNCPLVNSQDNVCLVLRAIKLKSAYQYSEEIPKNPAKFTTRHSASCNFGQMDAGGISYLGHLPQDLIGNCALDYYHPQDMDLIKDTYEAVIQEHGKPFRSKPYRFRVYNGTFAVLETDWSCFVNPWSCKLEFVIGQHRVIQGPINPNVFMPEDEDEIFRLPDELISDGKEMQNQIQQMLTETVARRVTDPLRQHSSRRRKDMALLMQTLLEQMGKTDNSETGSCSSFSMMERDSIMLGEISPHTVDNSHESSGDQSSATPPSYNQLNYKENIERFFQSQPKTEQSDESGGEGSNKMDTQNQSSTSDSKSYPNVDTGSNIRNFSGSNESGNNDQPLPIDGERESLQLGSGSLTQELLTRHNEDMEKYMMQRHKELRVKTPSSQKDNRHRHPDNLTPMHVVYPIASTRSIDNSSELVRLSFLKQRNRRGSPHKDRKSAQCCGHHAPTPAHRGLKRCGGNVSCYGDDFHNCLPKQPHLDFGNMAYNDIGVGGGTGASPSSILWPQCTLSSRNEIPTTSYSQNRYCYPNPSYIIPNLSSSEYGQITGSNNVGCSKQCPNEGHPIYAASSGNQNASIYDSPSIANAPFSFVPGGLQQQPQFLPPQVQLMPTGVIYQSIYGQHHSPILMPLMHSRQPVILGSHPPSKLTTVATPTTPDLNVLRISKPKPQFMAYSNPWLTKTVSCCKGNVASVHPLGKATSPGKASVPILRPPMLEEKAIDRNNNHMSKQTIFSSLGSTSLGSDESMTVSSAFSKSSMKEEMDQDQSISDQSMDSAKDGICKPNDMERNRVGEMEKVKFSPELSFRYRIPTRELSEVLKNDMEALKLIGKQSPLVNDQLTMLYNDLADEGLADNSALYVDEETSNSSNSSGGEDKQKSIAGVKKMTKKRTLNIHQYTRIAIIHEENAPFPPENLYKINATTSLLEKVAKVLAINSPIPATSLAVNN